MRRIGFIIGILLCLVLVPVEAKKRPLTEIERLEQAIARTPGDMALRCALVQAQLAEGDTTAAEQSLNYALKMEETSCLYMHKARLSIAKDELWNAARFGARAVKAGLRPDEDSLVYRIDSLSEGALTKCLQQLTAGDKQNVALWCGLGQLAQHRADSTAALRYYEEAYHLGDSTVLETIQALRVSVKQVSDTDSVIAEVPFTYQDQLIELKGKMNNLAIRIIVDTTATQSSISGIETMFMLKNNYITRDDVRDNTAVVVKKLELDGGVMMQDVVLQYESSQDSPVILCMRDLERLGRIAINEKKRVIEVR